MMYSEKPVDDSSGYSVVRANIYSELGKSFSRRLQLDDGRVTALPHLRELQSGLRAVSCISQRLSIQSQHCKRTLLP